MCGIAGIFSYGTEKVALNKLQQMTDAIIHRGPDGEGQWIDAAARIGLGHRRLSIIDLSDAGAQPMHYLDRYTITFNGEIYNYIELREELIQQGITFRTKTDTEVLLALYHRYGADCLSRLDGMWALAIWNAETQELFCARDRFGEKPFHYAQHKNQIYFASEMKALWAAGVPKVLRQDKMDAFVTDGTLYDAQHLDHTFYEGIYKLPHSHWMRIKNDGPLEIKRYFDIAVDKQDFAGTFEEACEEFRRLFRASLSRRCRSDVPVGTSLSGGLDSSTIVCSLSEMIGHQKISPHTFSARFEGFKKDEGVFIEQVIAKTGVVPHYIWPNGEEMYRDFEKLCWHQEEPFGSASIYAQYRVQQEAKNQGVTVLIDGQGADEILGGYVFYYTNYLNSFRQKNISRKERITEQNHYLDFHTPHRGLKKKLIQWSQFYDWRHKLNGKKLEPTPSLNESLYNDLMLGGLQELLRYADRNSMAHSREVRLPFLDHKLVTFCFSLPDSYKLRMGWTKYILRKSFEDILPHDIAWRKEKVGFEPPQQDWLKAFGADTHWLQLMKKTYYG
jgi:asparagine synthase (glutamine-hydrolysing)